MSSPITTFPSFLRLPAEVRELIWQCATPDHEVIVVAFDQQGCITDLITHRPSSLKCVCRHSRSVFLRRFPDTLQSTSALARCIAVSFKHDIFYLQGLHTWRRDWLSPSIHHLQNVVADNHLLEVPSLIGQVLGCFQRMEHFWVFLSGQPEQFQPPPDTRLRRPCNLHHHHVFPNDYTEPNPRQPARGRTLCPECRWNRDNFRGYDMVWYSGLSMFRIAFDSTLPIRPDIEQIRKAEYPVIGWVRIAKHAYLSCLEEQNFGEIETRSLTEKENELLELEWESWEAKARACVTNGGFNCDHGTEFYTIGLFKEARRGPES